MHGTGNVLALELSDQFMGIHLKNMLYDLHIFYIYFPEIIEN